MNDTRTKKRWTNAEREQIRLLFEQGKTDKQIAEQLHRTTTGAEAIPNKKHITHNNKNIKGQRGYDTTTPPFHIFEEGFLQGAKYAIEKMKGALQ